MVASTNAGKIDEFEHIWALQGVTGIRLCRPDAAAPTVDETGRSYVANARLKACAFAGQYSRPALGDDSGLSVAALGGGPGLRTARFGGPGLSAGERVSLLLDRLSGVPASHRKAYFVCALYVAFPDGRAVVAHGRVTGMIAEEPAGDGGFGYDPIFYLPMLGCTMAQLPAEEKHRVSHRGRAVRRLLARLREAEVG